MPDPALSERLAETLGEGRELASIVSFDAHPGRERPRAGALAADMQTAPLLAAASALGIRAAAVLIVTETAGGQERLDGGLAEAERKGRTGGCARTLRLKVEG